MYSLCYIDTIDAHAIYEIRRLYKDSYIVIETVSSKCYGLSIIVKSPASINDMLEEGGGGSGVFGEGEKIVKKDCGL